MTRVFVYGTLKRGYGNNRLLTRSRFLGEAITKDRFRMWTIGFPLVVLAAPGHPKTGHVIGELYEVSDATLRDLDRLESNGSMYERRERPIISLGETPLEQTAFIYEWLGLERGREVLPLNDRLVWK